jgi:multicomponent Na+:H+ antiporter subunit E
MIAQALLLTLAWVALTGDRSPGGVLFAAGLALAALRLARPLRGAGFARVRPLRIVGLVAYFLGQVLLANARVAAAVLGPVSRLRPGIVAVPLTIDRDAEIALLADLITLTPGTLSLELSEDRRVLHVHALDASDPEGLRRDIRDGFERRIREALR